MPDKPYKVGMFGGKFLPLHKGHAFCIRTAVMECEKLYVILFSGGMEEQKASKSQNLPWMHPEFRFRQIQKIADQLKPLGEVIPAVIDISQLLQPNGSDNWNAETPLVRRIVGPKLDAVYSSEPSYDPYFHKAYPEAVHRLVDVERKAFPISGTQIRNMQEKERWFWMI